MGRWLIVVLAAGVGLVAASARGEAVASHTVLVRHGLPANAVTGFEVSCPAGYAAVSAGVAEPGRGATLLSARPAGPRAYAFRFGNPAGNEAQRVTAAVACRTIRSVRPVLRVTPVKRAVTIASGRTQTASLACPANMLPAGSSIDLTPGRRASGAFGGAALSIRSSTAGPRGFRVAVRNAGGRARPAVVYGTCVTVLRQTSAPAPLRAQFTTFTDSAGPGRRRLVHRCPAGWSSLGAGYAVGSGGVRVSGAVALGTVGRWWVESERAATTRVRLQLVCARV